MTNAIELIVSIMVLLLCSAAVVSVLAAAFSHVLRRRIEKLPHRPRLLILGLLLGTPFLGTVLLAVWGSAPRIWAYVDDHCLDHTAGHSSACAWHLPQVSDPIVQVALLTGLLCLALIAMSRLLRLRHSLHQLRGIRQLAVFDAALGVWRLPVRSPMAFTTGLWRPACFVSEGMLEQLGSTEISSVCAHEQAHARRLDGLRQWVVRCLSLGHWPGIRRQLLNDWELASEQACDAAVVRNKVDRLALAQTLVKVARLQLLVDHTLPTTCHLTGGELESRVLALLHPAAHRPLLANSLALATGLALILSVGGLAPLLHHWLEWV